MSDWRTRVEQTKDGPIQHSPEIAEQHRLMVGREQQGLAWRIDCTCGWRGPTMRFAGDAALEGAQHVIDAAAEQAQGGKDG